VQEEMERLNPAGRTSTLPASYQLLPETATSSSRQHEDVKHTALHIFSTFAILSGGK